MRGYKKAEIDLPAIRKAKFTAMEKWVYVAGPYTHPDPIVNTQRAVAIAEELLTLGYVPIVPHLSMVWHLISPHDVDFWYEYDLRVMRRCHIVLRFDGESTGADREVEVAKTAGIPVFHSVADLAAAFSEIAP